MRRRYRWNPKTCRLEELAQSPVEFGMLIMPDLPAYVSPVTGKLVDGRRARREDLARTGSRPYEGREQEQKEINRRKAYAAEKREQQLDAAVRRAWSDMPPRVRNALRQQ